MPGGVPQAGMRLGLAAAVLLLAVPAAQACSTSSPTPGTFQFLNWDADDRLTFGFHDRYYTANVTTGDVGPAPGPTPYASVPQPQTDVTGPDGLHLAIRQVPNGMTVASCSGPSASLTTVGADLLDAAGHILLSWGGNDPQRPWSGLLWSNATHAFVWEHQQAYGTDAHGNLTVVEWSTRASATTAFTVPAGNAWAPYGATDATNVHGDALLLLGRQGAAVIDPHGSTLRLIASPFASEGWAYRDGDALFFGSYTNETGYGHADLDAARVRIADGAVLWQVRSHGGSYAFLQRGLALVDDQGGRILRWRDGVPLPDLPIGMKLSATPTGTSSVVVVSQRGQHVAFGIRGADERLLVLGPDLEPVLTAAPGARPSGTSSTEASPTSGDPNTPLADEDDDGVLEVPAPAIGVAVAVALAAVLTRRRLR